MSAARDYFEWKAPRGHAKGCKQTRWVLRERRVEHITGREEIELQAVCPADGGCGVALTWSVSLAPDRDDESGDKRSGFTWSAGPVEDIGYGTTPIRAPIRASEVWLHAGAPILRFADEGPEYYLVTRSRTPPADWSEVLGEIGRARRRGRQVKSRWFGAAGFVLSCRFPAYRPAATYTRDDLTSRTAAVAWVLEHAVATGADQATAPTVGAP